MPKQKQARKRAWDNRKISVLTLQNGGSKMSNLKEEFERLKKEALKNPETMARAQKSVNRSCLLYALTFVLVIAIIL
jgi:hypothetical protein